MPVSPRVFKKQIEYYIRKFRHHESTIRLLNIVKNAEPGTILTIRARPMFSDRGRCISVQKTQTNWLVINHWALRPGQKISHEKLMKDIVPLLKERDISISCY